MWDTAWLGGLSLACGLPAGNEETLEETTYMQFIVLLETRCTDSCTSEIPRPGLWGSG